MKDKLEIGMYVRTNDGYIAKLIKKNETWKYEFDGSVVYEFDSQIWDTDYADSYYDETELFESEIECLTIEPSFNIMDLIREGDLVTLKGEICKDEVYRVIGVGEDTIQLDCFQDGYMCVTADDIKQVLTKEQFMRECYEIGE